MLDNNSERLVRKGNPTETFVVMQQRVYNTLVSLERSHMPSETIGALIGRIRCSSGEEQVIIEDVTPIQFLQNPSGLTPDFAEWESIKARIEGVAEDARCLIGWFYLDVSLNIFPPRMNIAEVHQTLAPEADLLLLASPFLNVGAFYKWHNGTFVSTGGYFEALPDEHSESVIPWTGELDTSPGWILETSAQAVSASAPDNGSVDAASVIDAIEQRVAESAPIGFADQEMQSSHPLDDLVPRQSFGDGVQVEDSTVAINTDITQLVDKGVLRSESEEYLHSHSEVARLLGESEKTLPGSMKSGSISAEEESYKRKVLLAGKTPPAFEVNNTISSPLLPLVEDTVSTEGERLEEERRVSEETRVAEEARLAEAASFAEEERLAQEAEEQRLADEAEQASSEEARLAEQAHLEEEKLAAEARLADEAHLEEARLALQARLAEEAEQAHLAEEARLAEERRLAEEARLAQDTQAVLPLGATISSSTIEADKLVSNAALPVDHRSAASARIHLLNADTLVIAPHSPSHERLVSNAGGAGSVTPPVYDISPAYSQIRAATLSNSVAPFVYQKSSGNNEVRLAALSTASAFLALIVWVAALALLVVFRDVDVRITILKTSFLVAIVGITLSAAFAIYALVKARGRGNVTWAIAGLIVDAVHVTAIAVMVFLVLRTTIS